MLKEVIIYVFKILFLLKFRENLMLFGILFLFESFYKSLGVNSLSVDMNMYNLIFIEI